MRTRAAAVVAAAVVATIATAPAHGHEESALHALSVIERVTPEFSGVSFRVIQLTQPVLVATNRSGRALVILDGRGDPFLKLADGRIETNVASPLTYVSRDPTGRARPPGDLRAGVRPRWQVVERGHTWSWFDPRIRFAPERESWSVEARVGRDHIVVSGGFESLDGHGHFKTELIASPRVRGLDIRLLQGAIPGLYVRNDTGRVLAVSGRQGEPFLRIGPAGVVGNERSPDYYLGGTQTIRAVPRFADADARPRWRRLSRVPIWSWLELRARLPDRLHQRSVLGPTRRTVLRWTTPITLGRRPLDLRGRVLWIPPRGEAGAEGTARREPLWIGAAVMLALLGSLAVLLAARRHRYSRPRL